MSMVKDFTVNKGNETIAKNLQTVLHDVANREAEARRQLEEEDRWQPGERSQFTILDPEGRTTGLYSEEIDGLLDKEGKKQAVKC